MKNSAIQVDLRVALLYALFGGLWILLSDRLLAGLITDISLLTTMQTYKGWAFVVTSALLIYSLLHRELSLRRLTEGKFEESQERYRLLFETSIDAFLLTAPDGSVLAANSAATGMFGWTEEEIKNIGRNGMIDNADPRLATALEERANKGYFRGELTFVRKDGKKFPGEISTAIFKDSQGSQRTSMVIRDITERVQADIRIRQQLTRLAALREIDQAITASFDSGVSLSLLLSHAVKLLYVDAATVLQLNPEMNELEFAAGFGFRTNKAKTSRVKVDESYAGKAVLERRIVQIQDISKEPDNLFSFGFLKDEGFVSYYGAPLIVKGKVIGVLEVFNRAVVARDEDWLDFFRILAGEAAIAIDNLALYNELQRSNLELRLAYSATIEGWSRALDLRDRDTEGHTQRVMEKTIELARIMGMSEEQLVQIRYGTLLHDIGKMGVPDSILHKPGPLTEEEWDAMHKHPSFAYEMLLPIHYLQGEALHIPYCHHEKWDGSGYPRGLKGEQIPLAARLFSVVDVWDALTSDRPYRLAWSEEKALQYIKEQAGLHFDPKVVDVFLKSITSDDIGYQHN
jgi:PAS domain S-box-containing protein